MGGVQELVEKVKYADAALKKKIILGGVAGVLFVVAAVLLVRALMGPGTEPIPAETEQAATELRDKLESDSTTQTELEDARPFSRKAEPPPPR